MAPTATAAAPATSFLSQGSRGIIKQPPMILVYGPEGEGKTQLAAEAPEPAFIQGEKGSGNHDVFRFPVPTKWEDVLAQATEMVTQEHSFKSLVIDTLDALEPMVHAHICKAQNVKTIELASGGYGKGYGEAVEEFRRLFEILERVRARGIQPIILAHSKALEFNDPAATAPYMRYQVALQDAKAYSAANFWKNNVDALLFLNREITVGGKDKGARGFDDGTRYLFTERRPAWDAKNRFGLPEKIMLPQGGSWAALQAALDFSSADDPDTLIRQIKALAAQLADAEKKATVTMRLKEYGKDAVKLRALKGKIQTILGDQAD